MYMKIDEKKLYKYTYEYTSTQNISVQFSTLFGSAAVDEVCNAGFIDVLVPTSMRLHTVCFYHFSNRKNE